MLDETVYRIVHQSTPWTFVVAIFGTKVVMKACNVVWLKQLLAFITLKIVMFRIYLVFH